MPDSLYEHDALAWADHQAALLRQLASGEGVNEAVDWPHVIEEVQDVGLSELRACQSLLQQAMRHLLKLHAWPNSQASAHWHDEAGTFLDDASLHTLYAATDRPRRTLRQGTTPGTVSNGRNQRPAHTAGRMPVYTGRAAGW